MAMRDLDLKVTTDDAQRTVTVSGTTALADFSLLATDKERGKLMTSIVLQIEQAIVNHVAEQFLQAHLQDVLAAVDPVAVANLAIARMAAAIGERLQAPTSQEVPMAHSWTCGCGHVNGANLTTCARCERRPGDRR